MTINCKGELIDLSDPKIMGILNITPNSFFDGGKYKSDRDFLAQGELMLEQGADFLDLGAYSSKPSADFVTQDQELARIIPVVELLVKEFPQVKISIDTFRGEVARQSILAGACMVNDISGGKLDPTMLEVVGQLQVPYILMHMKGNPQTMQSLAEYQNITKEVITYFSEQVALAREKGIHDIIIDPGFGFAKTLEQNYELMQHMELLHALDLPILVGISRKSMIYKLLETTAEFALNGTTVLNTIALQKGASILRVHDVLQAVQTKKIYNALTR
ncbi:dihydropteroate synthase [Myroides sp. LJL116]